MEKCLKYSNTLFEKFSNSVNRKTQSAAWANIAKELNNEGTKVEDVSKLKQNVTNWIRRACVCICSDILLIERNAICSIHIHMVSLFCRQRTTNRKKRVLENRKNYPHLKISVWIL